MTMAGPGIIVGNTTWRIDDSGDGESAAGKFYSANPAATPKYARNTGVRRSEFIETTARLFIDMPISQLQPFLDTLPPETQPLALALAYTGTEHSSIGYLDFILTQAQEAFQEREQIVDTLTDNYVAFYSGQAAPSFIYSGALYNTYQDDQRVWMALLYQDVLRGTQLANRNLVARLRYDSFLVTGYIANFAMTISGETDISCSFNFQMRVKSISVFTPRIYRPGYFTETNGTIIAGNATELALQARAAFDAANPPEAPAAAPAAEVSSEDPRNAAVNQSVSPEAQIAAEAEAAAANQSVAPDALLAPPSTRAAPPVSSVNTNPQNVTNDGQQGTSNVYGASPELLAQLRDRLVSQGLPTATANRVATSVVRARGSNTP